MSRYLTPFSGAVELVNALIAELEGLSSLLNASKTYIRIDAIYGIDLRMSPRVVADQEIPVRILTGADAFACAKEVLTSIWLRTGQSPKETFRAPGAIALPREAVDGIERANRIRFELFGLVSLLTVKERKALWKKFPAISSLAALRTTQVLTAPELITFYWHTGNSGKRIQVKELIAEWDKHLAKVFGGRPRMSETLDGTLEQKLVYAIDTLEHIDPIPPDEQVCIHRPVAPHIRARYRDSSVPRDKELPIVQAPAPFIYELGSSPPKIKDLKPFAPVAAGDSGERGKNLSKRAQIMDVPHVESMHIYRYMEGHRIEGPVKKTQKQRNQRLTTSP